MWLFVTVVVLLLFMTRFLAKPSRLAAVVFFRLWKKYLLNRKTRFNPYEPKKNVFRGYWNEKFCLKFNHHLWLNASFSNLNRIFFCFGDLFETHRTDIYLIGFVASHQFLLLSAHYALWALIQFVLCQRHGQLQQEFLINWFQIVKWHPFRINYGIQNIVQRMKILLQTELIEQFAKTKWWSARKAIELRSDLITCQRLFFRKEKRCLPSTAATLGASGGSWFVSCQAACVQEAARPWNGNASHDVTANLIGRLIVMPMRLSVHLMHSIRRWNFIQIGSYNDQIQCYSMLTRLIAKR